MMPRLTENEKLENGRLDLVVAAVAQGILEAIELVLIQRTEGSLPDEITSPVLNMLTTASGLVAATQVEHRSATRAYVSGRERV